VQYRLQERILRMPKSVKSPYWITDKYIYTLLLVYPLFVGFHGYTSLTASKFVFLAAVTGLWLIALIVSISKNRLRLGKMSFIQCCMMLFVLACCVSAAVSPYFKSTLVGEGRFDGLLTIFLSLCIFMGVSAFARLKNGYVIALAVSVSLCCLIAVFQLFGYNALDLFPNDYCYYDGGYEFPGEFLGTIGNAGLFAAFLCLCIPLFSVYYTTAAVRPPWLLPVIFIGMFCIFASGVSAGKLAICLCLLFSAPLVISSGERLRRGLDILAITCLALCAAYSLTFDYDGAELTVSWGFPTLCTLSAAAAATSVILRLILKNCEIAAKTVRIAVTSVSVLAVLVCLAAVWNLDGNEGALYEFSRVMHGEADDSFGSSRILIWRKTLDLVKERPIFGGGPGTLPLRLDVEFSRYVGETGKTLYGSVDNAHNVYLGILVNTGAVSLALYLTAMISSLAGAIKRQSSTALCLASALLCCWIQDFFGLGLFIVSPIMWTFWGLLHSAVKNNIRLRV